MKNISANLHINSYINTIVDRIKNNYKIKNIILFGSYAISNSTKSSDIDLIVILDQKGISKNFEEKFNKKLKISKLFIDIKEKIPVDLLVYTVDEWERINELNSSFIRNIRNHGIKII